MTRKRFSARHLRARVLKVGFDTHKWIYQVTDGRIGAHVGLPILLLTVTGRKTGLERVTPLVYFRDGESYFVVASDGGARRNPQWFKNLQVDPKARIQVGRRKLDVIARVAAGSERERLWSMAARKNPVYEPYQKKTSRQIPVVILEPV